MNWTFLRAENSSTRATLYFTCATMTRKESIRNGASNLEGDLGIVHTKRWIFSSSQSHLRRTGTMKDASFQIVVTPPPNISLQMNRYPLIIGPCRLRSGWLHPHFLVPWLLCVVRQNTTWSVESGQNKRCCRDDIPRDELPCVILVFQSFQILGGFCSNRLCLEWLN